MHLQELHITDFKNIGEAQLEFSPKINILLGNNGMGKSNLLDAIYCLSLAKSYTGLTDAALIRHGAGFAMVRGEYERRGQSETLILGLGGGHRKTLRRGDKAYRRISEHIGVFPLVMSRPADMELAGGPPAERRRFIDQVISQSDAVYLESLMRYNGALEQRNSMLRSGLGDPILYEAVEHVMCETAAEVTTRRSEFISRLGAIFDRYHHDITGGGETVTLSYSSQLLGRGLDMQRLLDENRQRDLVLGHTSAGPHRDDIELMLDCLPLRRTASQGQAKSYTIALRLAQYDFLRQATGLTPLLLLDDLFDKLDAGRVQRIIDIVSRPTFGQIFISDTGRERVAIDGYHWMVTDGKPTRI